MAKKVKKLSDKQKLRQFFQSCLADKRTTPPTCGHFGDCGGCEFQDVPYADQLQAKRQAFGFIVDTVVEELREPAAGEADALARTFATLPEIVASPDALGYRQRMDYVFAFGMMGLRRVNRHRQVVELTECPLLGNAVFVVVPKARSLAEAAGLESYDYMRHTGELRYFVIRRSREGGLLLSLVTKTRDHGDAVMSVLNRLVANGDIRSGHWLLAPGLGDVSFGEPLAVAGEPWIEERLNGVSLRIGPNTFFQANPAVAEKAYAALRDFTPEGAAALDLYSGVGSIALTLAKRAASVTAVENVPDNLTLAEHNRQANHADNLTLIDADSAAHLRDLAESGQNRPDMMVLNPPRPGVGKDGMAAVARLAPGRLAYLSCNPFTLLRDLAPVLEDYAVRSVAIYDMFPQTRHFESLALLEKR